MLKTFLVCAFAALLIGCTTTTEFGNKTTTMDTAGHFKWAIKSYDDPFDGPIHVMQQNTRNTYSNTVMKFQCRGGKHTYTVKSMRVLAAPDQDALLEIKADAKPVQQFLARMYTNSYETAFLQPGANQYQRMVDIYSTASEIAVRMTAQGDSVQGLQFTTNFNEVYPTFLDLCTA